MPPLPVKVKWGKEQLELELDPDEDVDTFRAQLYALTSVPIENQKIMFKGSIVADSWAGVKTKKNMKLMLMGSAVVLEKPAEDVLFEEDLSEAERIKGSELAPGLKNQGNTCYLNSAVQMLAAVEGLGESLPSAQATMAAAGPGGGGPVQADLSRLFFMDPDLIEEFRDDQELARLIMEGIRNPLAFIGQYGPGAPQANEEYCETFQKVVQMDLALRKGAPFEAAVKGQLTGADADKGLSASLGNVFNLLKTKTSSHDINMSMGTFLMALRTINPRFDEKGHGGGYVQQDAAEAWSTVVGCLARSSEFVKNVFTFKTQETLTCDENPDEAPDVSASEGTTMMANISKDTGHVMACLAASQEGSIVKQSAALGREAQYTRKSQLTRAPGYLAVNMVRFHYKKKEQTAAKIKKDVKFSMELDVMPLCSKELIKKMAPYRDAFEKARDEEIAKEVEVDQSAAAVGPVEFEPYSFPDDAGSNNSGYYEMVGVLSHKGADTSSGHYVSWCKQADGKWLLFDDDKVKVVKEIEVMNLSGKSADGHISYMLLYAPKRLPKSSASGGGGGGGGAAMETATEPVATDGAMDTKADGSA